MQSGLRIEWSDEAILNLDRIFDYIEENWSEREIRQFAKRLERTLSSLSKYPASYPESLRFYGVRKCVLSPQTIIFYEYSRERILLLSLFDTRQDPEKLKIK